MRITLHSHSRKEMIKLLFLLITFIGSMIDENVMSVCTKNTIVHATKNNKIGAHLKNQVPHETNDPETPNNHFHISNPERDGWFEAENNSTTASILLEGLRRRDAYADSIKTHVCVQTIHTIRCQMCDVCNGVNFRYFVTGCLLPSTFMLSGCGDRLCNFEELAILVYANENTNNFQVEAIDRRIV